MTEHVFDEETFSLLQEKLKKALMYEDSIIMRELLVDIAEMIDVDSAEIPQQWLIDCSFTKTAELTYAAYAANQGIKVKWESLPQIERIGWEAAVRQAASPHFMSPSRFAGWLPPWAKAIKKSGSYGHKS